MYIWHTRLFEKKATQGKGGTNLESHMGEAIKNCSFINATYSLKNMLFPE